MEANVQTQPKMSKKEKKAKGKVKMTPEEIAMRKAQAAAKKALKDINPVLSDMAMMNKNGMPYFCKDYATPVSYEEAQKRLNLILSQASEDKYSFLTKMCFCVVYKFEDAPNAEDPPKTEKAPDGEKEEIPMVQKLTILICTPKGCEKYDAENMNADKLYLDMLEKVFPDGPKFQQCLHDPDNKSHLTANLIVDSFMKEADNVCQFFRDYMKTTGIYVEEESDDEDMGQMAEDAGIEW